MFRTLHGKQADLRLFFLIPLVCFAVSCEAQTVLGISRREAEKRLLSGNIDFITKADIKRLSELSRIDPAAPFYAALHLSNSEVENIAPKQSALFIEALKSPVVREAAFEKLMGIDSESGFSIFSRGILNEVTASEEISTQSVSTWIRACRHYSVWEQLSAAGVPELSADMLRFFLTEPLSAAHTWLWAKITEQKTVKVEQETAAPSTTPVPEASYPISTITYSLIKGRFAISKLDYGAALRSFRAALTSNRELFLTYPELLTDLGRAFQYTAPQEGLRFFSLWEQSLAKDSTNDIRYRLLFFAGRMARQIRRPQDALTFFAGAAECAPNNEQKDACIWYILDTAYNQKEENLVSAAKTWALRWHDPSYFDDLFDKFGAWAAKKRRFELIRSAFFAINGGASAEIYSRYAYICGRSIELGLIPKRSNDETAAFFYKLAYNGKFAQKNSAVNVAAVDVPSFYYRSLAADRLERPLNLDDLIIDLTPPLRPESENPFFEGFFRFGAAKFIYPYLRAVREKLPLADLRYLAGKLNNAREWQSSINLTLYYMKRAGYKLSRRDLELRFPHGYPELIERYAKEAKIESTLLYGLVRRESVFNAAARSRVGAAGLTQLMSTTGNEMARQLAQHGGANYVASAEDGMELVVDLYNPEINLHLGALYYRQLLDMTQQSAVLATLAYNGGIGRIRRWRRAAQDLSDDLFLETVELTETRNYGRGVLGDEVVYRWLSPP